MLPGDPEYGDGYTGKRSLRPTGRRRPRTRTGPSAGRRTAGRERHRRRRARRSAGAHPRRAGPGLSPAGAAGRCAPNPGMMTRSRHQHLPRRDREIVVDRPRTGRRGHLDAVAGPAAATHPLDRLHPHPRRPLAGCGRAEGAHRRRGPGLRQPRRAGGRSDARRRRPDRGAPSSTLVAVHTPGHASNHLCYLLRPGAAAVLRRPHHGRLHRGHQPARRGHGRLPGVAPLGAGARPGRHRPRSRAPDRATPPQRSTTTSATAWSGRSRSSPRCARPGGRPRPSSWSPASTPTCPRSCTRWRRARSGRTCASSTGTAGPSARTPTTSPDDLDRLADR